MNNPIKASCLFTSLMICVGFSFGVLAQETNRERIISKKQSPRAKPKAASAPEITPQALSNLRSRIGGILASKTFKKGHVGLKIVSMDSGVTIAERNVDKYFMPASNMKTFTIATAIEKLTPNYRFVTSIYSNSKPDRNGVLNGNLIVYGRGDPSLSASFNDGDYYKGIDALVEKIIQAGVKQINGSIIGDETYFNSKPIPNGWEWNDLQWYYGAEVSALTVNDNSVDLQILPGSEGTACVVRILPSNKQFRVINRTQTVPTGRKREIIVTKELGQNVLKVSGSIPKDDEGFRGSITVTRPARLFVELLKKRLQLRKVIVKGDARAINLNERNGMRLQTEYLTEIAKLKSPPLKLDRRKDNEGKSKPLRRTNLKGSR